jgi:hypothetical protein
MAIYTAPSDFQSESPKMKLAFFSNEFPHDDLQELLRRLHVYSKDRRYTILARFLDEATLAVRDEVRLLPTELRALIPLFESILNLADDAILRKGPLCGSIDGVLLCALELGANIGYIIAKPWGVKRILIGSTGTMRNEPHPIISIL